jgi:hypothetical protein
MKKVFCFVAILTGLCFSATLDLKYGDILHNNGSLDVYPTNDGGYILAGYTNLDGVDLYDYDGYLIKTDSSGIVEWQNVLKGEGMDMFIKVKQISDGGYIVLGRNDLFLSETANVCKPWLIQYDQTGRIRWEKTYEEVGSDYNVSDLIIAEDAGFLILGSKKLSISQTSDTWLMKVDAHGKKTWEQVYDYGYNDRGSCIVKSLGSGYFIVSDSELYFDSELKYQLWAMNVDETGYMSFNNVIDFSSDSKICYSLCSTTDNSYIISGFTNIEKDPIYGWTGDWGPFVLKFKLFNSLEWIKYISSSNSVADADNGTFITLGSSNSDILISKFDYSGNLLWNRNYGSTLLDYGSGSIAHLSDNSYVLCGTADVFNNTSRMNLIKTDKDGFVIYAPLITSFGSDSNYVSINWNPVPNAGSYIIYNSDRVDSNFVPIDTTTVNTWSTAANDSLKKKFYYIKASTNSLE